VSFTDPLALALLLVLIPLVKAWVNRPNALTPQRKRVALALRCMTVLCLVLALAGAQMVTLTNNVTVVFLMDRSLSTGGDSQGWQREFAAQALRSRDEKDQYGIVLFGKDSRIELASAPHDRETVDTFSVVVDRSASGMTSALRFAATAFPGDTASRMVVLSDGQSTEAETGEEAAALAAAGIEVWTIPLPDSQVKDLLISRLEAPNQIAVNEPFVLRTVVESAGIGEAELLLSANGKPSERVRLKLREGPNLFLLPQRVKLPGPVRYEARVIADQDERPENNKGEALLVAGDEQSVVVLRAQPGPGALVPWLQKAGLKARAVTPAELPRRVGAWRDTSALVIEDVSAIDWSLDTQKVVSLLVRDGGMGLVMLGSDATFGVGGYQHTAIEPLLPVNLAVRRPKDMPLAALVQCLDKSGSMSGRPIEMAREAAIAAGDTLSEKDLLGLVAFDDASRWIFKFQEKGDGQSFKKKVASLRAGGGTDMYPGLKDAIEALEDVSAPLKHVIVLSDGATAPADFDALMTRAVAQHITVSAVALGSGADITFLTDLTKKGRGRLYRAPEASAASPLPQIFIRETLLATGSGVNDKPTEVRPTNEAAGSPLLDGLQFAGTPPISAYNMSSVKGGTASTLLQSPKKDPILAVGRAGLGKTAAWTSDMGGVWAASWMSHPGAGGTSLLETILLRTIRSVNAVGDLGERSRGNQLEAQAMSLGDVSSVSLRMVSREPLKGPVKAVVVNSRGESIEAVLHPETPFLATGSVQVTEPGSALVFAQDPEGQLLARCNLSVPLTPEFARLGTNRDLLKELAQRSGGRFDAAANEVFRAPIRPFPLRTPLGFDLIRGALLLLLLEIAVRRLPIPKRLGKPKETTAQLESAAAALRQQMSQLRETKRATREPARSLPSKPRVQRASAPPAAEEPARAPAAPPVAPPDSTQSTMSRLREAKKRGSNKSE
jgi:Ca-activated chloride channel family protein